MGLAIRVFWSKMSKEEKKGGKTKEKKKKIVN